jgi:hypothetical protein
MFAMADERPQDKAKEGLDDATPPDSTRPRRAPPTIDLEATEVSSEALNARAEATPESAAPDAAASAEPEAEKSGADRSSAAKPDAEEPAPVTRSPISPPISPWVIAPLSGAVAAALVIGVGWMLGWPPVQSAPQVTVASVDALTARVAGLEAKLAKPATPASDPAAAARIAALEKTAGSLRDELNATRAQSEKTAARIAAIKSSPDGAVAPTVDLSAITDRLDAIEQASRNQGAAIEQVKAQAKADDAPLRRVVMASLLDLSVRQGDPFAATLSAAKTAGPDAAALKPLEGFAATGVPTAASLSRELLALVPKLSPPPAEKTDSAGTSMLDRLKANAENFVHIERTDATGGGTGSDRGAIVARIAAAAQRNDIDEARRELKTLAPADRAVAQSWIDKADARDAALAASRQFAADAMAALAKPAQ